ncbi:hypothetical protein PCANB_002732 [Pneumocystis canis]|nr:hypothetical protein PCANB_002732 [Pneumocystis canis]
MFFVMIQAVHTEHLKKRSESKSELSVKNVTSDIGNLTSPLNLTTTNLTQTNITAKDSSAGSGSPNGSITITIATGSFMLAVLAFIASLMSF